MAQKQVVLDQEFKYVVDLVDAVYALDTLTGTQKSVLLMVTRDELPCRVQVSQRTPKGTLDVQVGKALYKISQRAKLKSAVIWA